MSKTNASFGICRADKFIGVEGIFTTLTVGGVVINGMAAGVTQVNTSTGLTGGPITGTGTILLADTAVTPASYTNANITVDAQGRIIAAANGVAGSSGVTQVDSGVGLTGGPITTTGTLDLANTAVVAGNYIAGNFTVDAQGRLTSAANGNVGVTSVATGTGLTGGIITGAGTILMADTAVTPGLYDPAAITVDQQGRITLAATSVIGTGVTNVATGTGLTGGPITGTGTIDMEDTAVTPGAYTNANITVDQQGRLTSAASGAGLNGPQSRGLSKIGNQNITVIQTPVGFATANVFDQGGLFGSRTSVTFGGATGLYPLAAQNVYVTGSVLLRNLSSAKNLVVELVRDTAGVNPLVLLGSTGNQNMLVGEELVYTVTCAVFNTVATYTVRVSTSINDGTLTVLGGPCTYIRLHL